MDQSLEELLRSPGSFIWVRGLYHGHVESNRRGERERNSLLKSRKSVTPQNATEERQKRFWCSQTHMDKPLCIIQVSGDHGEPTCFLVFHVAFNQGEGFLLCFVLLLLMPLEPILHLILLPRNSYQAKTEQSTDQVKSDSAGLKERDSPDLFFQARYKDLVTQGQYVVKWWDKKEGQGKFIGKIDVLVKQQQKFSISRFYSRDFCKSGQQWLDLSLLLQGHNKSGNQSLRNRT